MAPERQPETTVEDILEMREALCPLTTDFSGWIEFGRKQAERIEQATLDLVYCPHCGASLYHEVLTDFHSPLLTCPQCKIGVAPSDLVAPRNT